MVTVDVQERGSTCDLSFSCCDQSSQRVKVF